LHFLLDLIHGSQAFVRGTRCGDGIAEEEVAEYQWFAVRLSKENRAGRMNMAFHRFRNMPVLLSSDDCAVGIPLLDNPSP
jgi:hypothetical protein